VTAFLWRGAHQKPFILVVLLLSLLPLLSLAIYRVPFYHSPSIIMIENEGVEVGKSAVSEDTPVENDDTDKNNGAPEASPQQTSHDEKDPETGSQENNINIDKLVRQLEECIDAETKRYKSVVYVLWIVAIVFLFIWIVGLPLAIAFTEDWTYQAAWYFSIQAGFGVGYGALTVRSKGMEVFLSIHCFLGAISISFLIAYLLSRMIDKADQKKKKKAVMVQEDLGEPTIGWQSWIVGSILLVLVMVMGILYGVLYEKWDFTESLYFIVSTCQTSGLLPPSINAKDPNNVFAPLFVSLLVVLAVPLWAYNIGKASVELVNLDRAQRRQSSVMKRDREAQEAFMRLAPAMGVDVSDPGNIQVDLAGFLVQWLLFDRISNEDTIAAMIAEFNGYLESEGGQENAAPQWKIVARVRFLQLVQLGILERDDWPAFCDEASQVVDKSLILRGSAKPESGDYSDLKVSNSVGDSAASKG